MSRKSIVLADVFLDARQAAAGHRVLAGVGEGDGEFLFVVLIVVGDGPELAQRQRDVAVHRLVIEEIFLDDVAFVAQAKNELGMTVVGVRLHDVPEDRPAADFDHRLGSIFGFFAQTGALAAAQDDDFHGCALSLGIRTNRVRGIRLQADINSSVM